MAQPGVIAEIRDLKRTLEQTLARVNALESSIGLSQTRVNSLRAHYQEDSACYVTHIALWRAYGEAAGRDEHAQLQSSKDFITNVSTTFSNAIAPVVQTSTKEQAYIIRGIRSCAIP
ncbi:uncharacterized protein BDZ99DRAFT_513154 [Mytilinidion resinicola]|uniref:RFX-type winged-helix domain-containing protein n=1 Tax=Mytilinidion resinicola TaxID=574789 RepID=A0A6A6Z9C4_9PEZI|nr:uncharacterized protein BDZ99DRAFT_513154 [Mytilinidion resinicola]KAF2816885.1 hypothetical protein BDZ99DRAFT_513154 [Mytilinidion resinicola]